MFYHRSNDIPIFGQWTEAWFMSWFMTHSRDYEAYCGYFRIANICLYATKKLTAHLIVAFFTGIHAIYRITFFKAGNM